MYRQKSNRAKIKSVGIALAAFTLFALPGTGAPQALPDTVRISILHTNGLEGRMTPFSYNGAEGQGGLARIVHLMRSLAPPDQMLRVDGGDALGPHLTAQFDSGRSMVELLNQAGYDALVIGNHEFAYGADTLKVRARQARFLMLGANLVHPTKDAAFPRPYGLFQRNGIKVAVIGLLSPQLKTAINPGKAGGFSIEKPGDHLQRILAEVRPQADYVVCLTHMPFQEVLALAQSTNQVDLFIGGGFDLVTDPGVLPTQVELANGTRLVTVPKMGTFVGRIDLDFVRSAERYAPVGFTADLIKIDARLPGDADATALIRQQTTAFAQARSQVIGRLDAPLENTPQFVVDLMRQTTGTEVAMVNLGTLRQVVLRDSVRLRQIDRLIRFDDTLVRLRLPGKELKRVATASKARPKGGQLLLFSGFDPQTGQVAGRPLLEDEEYTVVTTGFLAGGGDAYLDKSPKRLDTAETWPDLKEMVIAFFQRQPRISAAARTFDTSSAAWKSRFLINQALAWTELNAPAGQYKGVSQLSGRDAIAWNASLDGQLSRLSRRGTLAGTVKTSFGQVRQNDKLEESVDRLDADLSYTLNKKSPAPFVALNLNTVWTSPNNTTRPLTLRGSSGLHLELGTNAKMRVGLGVQRDFAKDDNQIGVELVPEYQRKFASGNAFQSKANAFFGVTEPYKISVQHYNRFLIRLWGDLFATISANFFPHWDNQVDEFGLKSEVQMGLGYTWNRKWPR